MITDAEWDEMKVAEKREWLREQVGILQVSVQGLDKRRIVDKTARMKITDLQKAIEHLSVKLDNLSARIGVVGTDGYRTKDTVATIVMRQHKLIDQVRACAKMLGIVEQ